MEKVEKEERQMDKQMNRNVKLTIALGALVVLVVATAFLASYEFTSHQPTNLPPFFPHPADVQFYFVARTVFSVLNITLLIILIVTYAGIFLKTRSEFTIGLLIFAIAFLIKDVAASPFVGGAFGFGQFGFFASGQFLLWFVLLPDLCELIALSVLVYLSIKY